MKVTRLDIMNAIWREICADRGYSEDTFIDRNGFWKEEEFDGEKHVYTVLREATSEEIQLNEALDVLENMFSYGKAYDEVKF